MDWCSKSNRNSHAHILQIISRSTDVQLQCHAHCCGQWQYPYAIIHSYKRRRRAHAKCDTVRHTYFTHLPTHIYSEWKYLCVSFRYCAKR